MKITDKMRLDWLAKNISSWCVGKGPVSWHINRSMPYHDIFEKPETKRVRQAIDAAIKAEARRSSE